MMNVSRLAGFDFNCADVTGSSKIRLEDEIPEDVRTGAGTEWASAGLQD